MNRRPSFALALICVLLALGSVAFVGASAPLADQEIFITPASLALQLDETASVQVTIVIIHSNCPLDIDDTTIVLPDVVDLVDETDWASSGGSSFTKDLTVRAVQEGVGYLTVIRDCPRYGLLEKKIPISVGDNELPVLPGEETFELTWSDVKDLRLSEIAQTYGIPLDELISGLGLNDVGDPTALEVKRTYGHSNESILNTIETLYYENSAYGVEDTGRDLLLELYQRDYVLMALMALSIILFFYKRYSLRYATLALALLYFGFYLGGCMSHIGAIGNLFLRDSTIIRLHWIVLVVVPVVTSMLFGRVFCGWVCFFGTVQQFLYDLRRKAFPKMRKIDPPRYLHLVKFLVLFAVVYYAAAFSRQIICEYDPFFFIFNLTFTLGVLGALTAILVVASLFVERPFCRYVCPLGAILWVTEKLPLFRIRTTKDCNSCGLCNRVCPMNKDIPKDEGECICCGECINRCRKGSMRYGLK